MTVHQALSTVWSAYVPSLQADYASCLQALYKAKHAVFLF